MIVVLLIVFFSTMILFVLIDINQIQQEGLLDYIKFQILKDQGYFRTEAQIFEQLDKINKIWLDMIKKLKKVGLLNRAKPPSINSFVTNI